MNKKSIGFRKSATSKQGNFTPARKGMTAGFPNKNLPKKEIKKHEAGK